MAEFNVNNLYKRVFKRGRGLPFDDPEAQGILRAEDFPDAPTGVSEEEESQFVNMRRTLLANTPNGLSIYMPTKIGDVLLPNEPTLDIAGHKMIQRTTITGNTTRRGTVKELIYTDDYEIRIRGVALNFESAHYPEDIVKQLNDLYLQNRAHRIECALTALLGVTDIVIEEVWFPHTPGQHAQAYEIIAFSDEPFELDIDS